MIDKYNELNKKIQQDEAEEEKGIKKLKMDVENTQNVYIRALIAH